MPPIAAAALLGKRNAGAQARDGEFEHVTTRVTICASTCEEHSSARRRGGRGARCILWGAVPQSAAVTAAAAVGLVE